MLRGICENPFTKDPANPQQPVELVIAEQKALQHLELHPENYPEPLIYLHSREKWTVAVGLQTFNALYAVNTHLIMAASTVMVIPCIIIFFFSQQIFMQGVVISGVKG